MATRSSIEWTEHTWNPVIGCTKISSGCKHCYAEALAYRLKAMGIPQYSNGFEVRLLPERLEEPIHRKKATKYFVNSMSDLFHEEVPDAFIDSVFAVIDSSKQHIFQILTKRAERMELFFASRQVPSNAWLGVSVEDRKHGMPRVENLRRTSAEVRFLSMEPLLESVGTIDLTGIHWVIVGGESGPRARRLEPAWAEEIRDQCLTMQVPFFFKQWGAFGADGIRGSKNKTGRQLGDREWNEYPT
jgi:protein gp37